MGSEQAVTTATPASPGKSFVPGFYFREETAEPAFRDAATAVPVFLYAGPGNLSDDPAIVELKSFALFTKMSGEDAHLRQSFFASAVKGYFENGGARCFIASLGTGAADAIKEKVDKVINAIPVCTLMCVPRDMDAFDLQSASDTWSAVLAACEASRRVFALIDLPKDPAEAKGLLEHLQNTAGARDALGYGAAYWPPVEVEGGHVVLPCGMVAAAIEKTDRNRGVWKAPANVVLANVYNTTSDVTKVTALFENEGNLGVNAIRVFPGRGVKVWGCRTLVAKQDKNRSFVQSSRMLSYIENNLQRLSRFAVFEPSNEITWVKLHNIIHAWLHGLWLKGGLAGATEKEAFRVLVGRDESMTDADILKGELKADIAFALQQPLQFINLQIRMIGDELTVASPSNAGGASQ